MKDLKTRRAVFLDRDGTINEDVGDLYKVEKLQFISGAVDSLKLLQEHFLLFIITNQDGIGKGSFTESEYLKFNKQYIDILNKESIKIEEVFYCPHSENDNCICRKPKTYFIDIAREKYNLNLKKSFIIGDHPSDVELGIKTGMKSIFLLTGHGSKHLHEIKNIRQYVVSKNIYEAALLILKLNKKL